MKKLALSPRNMLTVLPVLMLLLPASFVAAQDEAPAEGVAPAIERIAGTWKVDMEQTKEVASEEGFEMMSKVGDEGISMSFGDDGQYTMKVGSAPQEESVTYTISAVEGEENLYAIVVQLWGKARNAKVLFKDANTIKFMPEGEDPAILVRVIEEEAEGE